MVGYQSVIRPPFVGKTVIEYLTGKFPYHSLEEWTFLVEEGRITVSGNLASMHKPLLDGEVIEYNPIPGRIKEPEVDTNYSILKETEDFLFVEKPGNLPMHPAGRYRTKTLLSFLETKYPKIIPVHRLDRETSGIVIFAKSEASRKWLQKKFETRVVYKEYFAIVLGKFTKEQKLDGYIGRDIHSVIRKKMIFSPVEFPDSKSCATHFVPILYNEDKKISLVLVKPITGRIHQIRASLLYLGFPIIGDKMYGLRESIFLDFVNFGMTDSLKEELGFERQLLHAYSIRYLDDRVIENQMVHIHSKSFDEMDLYFPNWKNYVP
ncbi:RluA family pseudouridine synthase [Leptospira biflexa]|uniref:RluA family pseudouridine synthase n=1 Tax=Leptospira biflexa TaxID=172 RepID=UPI001083070C|nr:RluA family pseudouridine synthase [Leptospira biflexa]TGM34136.1 RluA family pseudouridine synthase [Leptospira biflexa]TGM40206.1 RluA family pseudouridine synthase [Leptospira biflexa]